MATEISTATISFLEHAPAPTPAAAPLTTHQLDGKWDLYYHLPHNGNWDLGSYKTIMTNITTMEEVIAINDIVPEAVVRTCMLFVMRAGITPLWEDARNRTGGCFSFKILNKCVFEVWRGVFYALTGGVLFKTPDQENKINGITISPKKNFCILKIWLADCSLQNPDIIADIPGLMKGGCLFKQHAPEY